MTFPIDRALALRQLSLLGYSESDPVYLRFFYPSDDPRKNTDKGRKSDRLDWLQIEAYQRQGRGAYFVINGGGHKNEDVAVGRAIFIEHDHLDKEVQRELWKTLDLPEPTFQIDTGGKSIHSYWVFAQPISLEKWCELQRDFLEFADGDRSIKNPARVMRLAGAWHISFDESGNQVYNQSLIIFESGKTYTYEELREIIPKLIPSHPLPLSEPELGEKKFPQNFDKSENFPLHPEEIEIPVAEPVPLECCLAKESRYLLEHGVAIGGRNTSGAKLARDLIGTYNYLLSIGQSIDGDPRQFLENYASRCNPSLDAREVETIWQSANRSHPTPSCGSEGVNNCIKGWKRREHLSSRKSSRKSPIASRKLPHSARYEATALTRDLDASWQIDEILERHLPDSEQDLALVELAKSLDNYNASEIRAIANKRIEERHRQDNLEERRTELERLERLENEEYSPFEDLFYDHPQVASAFEHLCRVNQKIQPQYFLGLLSPMSSLIGIKGSLDVPVLGSFRATINIALVGESGAGKSIVSKTLLKPMYRLQKELQSEHLAQTEQYRCSVEQWELQHPDVRGPKPIEKDFVSTSDAFLVINEYSREGIVKNHADNPNGLLIHQEELIAIQRAQNMYRQGKGDDRQFLNNLYDNATITRALRSERIIVPETAVAIFGGYQPAIVLSEMGDLGDPDGQWARFNFINGIEKRVHTDLNQPTVDLSDFLYHLYRKALLAPTVNCRLDRSGIEVLQKFVNEMEDLHWRTLQGGLRAVYSKAAGEVCRLALGLHWTNSLIAGESVPEIIPARAIKKAIQIKRYFLRQIQTIRTWGEADPKREEGVTPMYREIQKIARRLKGTTKFLTIRMVQQARLTLFKGLNSEGIKKIFQDLAAMGKAKLTKWKRGIALLIDSMGESGDNHPTTVNDSPNPGGNDSSSQETSSTHPVLLKSVGSLLKDFEEPKNSVFNGFNSFVESVESVGSHSQIAIKASCLLPSPSGVDLPTFATRPTIAQSFIPNGLEIVETSPTNLQQNFDSKLKWLMELLADLEAANRERFPNSESLMASVEKAEQSANGCLEQLTNQVPNYWERVLNAIALMESTRRQRAEGRRQKGCCPLPSATTEGEQGSESPTEILDSVGSIWLGIQTPTTILPFCPLPPASCLSSSTEVTEVTESESDVTQPTLAECKALLLAAETLTDLKRLKKKHGQQVTQAYRSLKMEEQLKIDGISATHFEVEIYKYIGQTIEQNGQKLATGALVYIEPKFKLGSKSIRVPVWLIKGLKLGWRVAIEVSRDYLIAVEKAILSGTEIVRGEQGLLFEP